MRWKAGWSVTASIAAMVVAMLGSAEFQAIDTDPIQAGPTTEIPFVVDRSWLTGDWDPLPNAPPRCDSLIARNPSRDVAPLRWKPCSSGRPGCSVVDVDWSTSPGPKMGPLQREGARPLADGRVVYGFRRWYPKADGTRRLEHMMTIIQDLYGQVLFAEALPFTPSKECSTYVQMSRTHMLYGIIDPPRQKLAFRPAPWTAPRVLGGVELPFAKFGEGGPAGGVVNATHLLALNSAGAWVLANHRTGETTLLKTALDDPRELPEGFLVRQLVAGFPVVFASNDGTVANLLTAPKGRMVTGYAVDRTAGNTLVWVEATGVAPSTDPVLYTAPFSTSRSALVPRRVTAYDDPAGKGGGYMIAANGVVVTVVSPTRALVVNLATGDSQAVDAEPDTFFSQPVWADSQYVWIETGTPTAGGEPLGLVRFERRALGPILPAK